MAERRFLGIARVRTEGEPARFDEGVSHGNYIPRGAGQMIRDAMEGPWYVVRDKSCSYDIDDEEAAVWTLSRSRTETGWETDSGFGGYGLIYWDARELADGANRKR
jgi:hypothetical protein